MRRCTPTLIGAIVFALALGGWLAGCGEEERDFGTVTETEPPRPGFETERRAPAPDVAAGRQPAGQPAALPRDSRAGDRDAYVERVQQRLASLEERAQALGEETEQAGQQASQQVEQQIQSLRAEVESLELDERWEESTQAIDSQLEEIERSLREQEQT